MRAPYAAIWNNEGISQSADEILARCQRTYLEVLLADAQLTQKSPYLDRDIRSQGGPFGRKRGLRATTEPAGERLLKEQERRRRDAFGSQGAGSESGEVSREKSIQDELCG